MFWKIGLKRLTRDPVFYMQNKLFSESFTIKQINNLIDLPRHSVVVKGWIRSVRSHKDVVFLDVHDGTTFSQLQVVVPASSFVSEASYGSSVEVHGMLERSSFAKQKIELKSSQLNIIGQCDCSLYPIKIRQKHSFDYLRNLPHLKFRTNTFSSLMRIRSAASFSVHDFFHKENFCHVHVPILTTNDCEGAGEVFQVEPPNKLNDSSPATSNTNINSTLPQSSKSCKTFFGVPTFLTVSGQLHLEVISGALLKAYSFGPTFRAESSHTRHHLSEFSMIEAELAFTNTLRDITACVESLLKKVTSDVMSRCRDDLNFFLKNVAKARHEEKIEKIVSKKFYCITYTDAIEILTKSDSKFQNKVFWGIDLHKEHEQHLVNSFDSMPVFVINYPASIKPFYALTNEDKKTVASVDLLFPDVGEVCGGSLREYRSDLLEEKLANLPHQSLDWYLDLRRFGSCPHGGFGLGFDRYIQMLLGLDNIRDTIPFPRSAGNCKL